MRKKKYSPLQLTFDHLEHKENYDREYDKLYSLYYGEKKPCSNRSFAMGDISVPIQENNEEKAKFYYDSLTSTAKQVGWRTPTEFPLCPIEQDKLTITEYANNLKKDKLITRNGYTEHYIDDFKIVGDELYIRTHSLNKDDIKPYSLMVVFLEEGYFLHHGTLFFEEIGATKYFTEAIGEKWEGGEVFDDYCN